LLHLVGCLHRCTNDTRSHKHQETTHFHTWTATLLLYKNSYMIPKWLVQLIGNVRIRQLVLFEIDFSMKRTQNLKFKKPSE